MAFRPKAGARLFLPIMLVLVRCSVMPSVVAADSLTTNASGINGCTQTSTVSSGSTQSVCGGTAGNTSVVGKAVGSLGQGTIRAEASVFGSGTLNGGGAAQSSIAYNFSVLSGPSSGTTDIDLAIEGTAQALTGNLTFSIILSPGESFPGCITFPTACSTLANGDEEFSLPIANPAAQPVFETFSIPSLEVATPYSGGVADVSYELSVTANCNTATPCATPAGADVNFLNTVGITGGSVYDTNGNLVSGATLISETGFNPNATATPEPSSLMLLGTGLLALVGAAKLKLLLL
jgi:hypothetical protein